jgi:hypothetical protein
MNPAVRTILMVLLLAPLAAPAQEPPALRADRPAATVDARCVPRGLFQNELGYTHRRVGEAREDQLGEWLFRWGLWRDVEARLEVGGWRHSEAPGQPTRDGWSDGGLGLKWTSQHGEGPRPTAALVLATSLPTGGADWQEDTLQPEAVIAMAWDLGGGVELAANAGYTYASLDLERFDRWLGSLRLGMALGRRFDCFLEGYGYSREAPDGESTGYLDVGLGYLPTPNLRLDARVGAGRNGVADDWFASVGVTWRGVGP